MNDPQPVTSEQSPPGEPHPDEVGTRQGEDLVALLTRLLDQVKGSKSQKDLAREAGITYPTLNAWMNRTRGTSRVDPDTLRALARVFRSWGVDVTVKQLFEADGRVVPGATDKEREQRLLEVMRKLPVDSQRALLGVAEAMRKGLRIN